MQTLKGSELLPGLSGAQDRVSLPPHLSSSVPTPSQMSGGYWQEFGFSLLSEERGREEDEGQDILEVEKKGGEGHGGGLTDFGEAPIRIWYLESVIGGQSQLYTCQPP